jgi:hypothetical protein
MSFKRLEQEDFVISSDAVSSTVWSTDSPTLSTFATNSVQEAGSTGNFYLNIYQTSSNDPSAEVQFAISYGNKYGSGSILYNPVVPENSPTKTIYGQYQNLVLGDENSDFVFGGTTSNDFWVISVDRARYKEKLFLGSFTLSLSGSGGMLSLTENSKTTTSQTFTEAGRVFQIVSGSTGTVFTGVNSNGYSPTEGSYGWFLPDIGTILLNPTAISESIQLAPSYSINSDGLNNRKLFDSINNPTTKLFRLNSEETITSDYIFIRPRNSEFNYSTNPSYISGSTGEVVYPLFINSPQTYITTVGLYNDNNELLAVAKVSRPLLKDFTKEALIKIKLDF